MSARFRSPARFVFITWVMTAGVVRLDSLHAAVSRFYFGNDLSYVNQMEDCGAVYREAGVARDPFEILADHGMNLVRVRLWHDPWWQPLIPQTASDARPQYSDLPDVIKTISRAKALGLHVLLDFHFSDFWADPGRQVMPRAWSALANDDAALEIAVHDYVRDVLTTLDVLGLMPELVQLGNENNPGILISQTLTASWNATTQTLDFGVGGIQRTDHFHFGGMWNAAIRAVREVGAKATLNPRIALHVADPAQLVGFGDWMQQIGIADFDIMGLSYYYAWHGGSIASMGQVLRQFRAKYPQFDVLVVETGYLWDQQSIDGLGNIINTPDPTYLPVGKVTQRQYMVDLTQEVIDAGGIGVVFWEPAWVSTVCRTPWGVGSSHEHVAYFDHRDGNNFHAGGTWMEAGYTGLPPPPVIVVQPQAMTAGAGADAFFSVTASGDNLTFQWRKDGVPVAGAVTSSLFIAGVTAADAGTYTVVVSNGFGSVESEPCALTVTASGTVRLTNLSARAHVGSGSGIVIPGFVITGSGATTLLVRGIGPTLAQFGVAGALADPRLSVVPLDGTAIFAQNDNWSEASNVAEVEAAREAVGAFALPAASLDASLLVALSSGAYAAPTSGAAASTGVGLVEIYDAGGPTAGVELINLSARAHVGTGSDVLIPGFVVQGDVAMTVLIRAVGPQLVEFGVTDVLADPQMTLQRALADGRMEPLAANDDWGKVANASALATAAAAVGAFELSPGSNDAALLVALNPGVYTVTISGVDGGTGVALMEIYRVAP